MSENLSTYLNDHLAGSRFAVDLLERLREVGSGDQELNRYADQLAAEIEEDRTALQQVIEAVGSEPSTLKEATAWMAEKASRVKLRLGAADELSIFESLEALSLGVLGKLKLWQALTAISDREPRVCVVNLEQLVARAERQHDELESRRRIAAQILVE